jgi:hypothetical protein
MKILAFNQTESTVLLTALNKRKQEFETEMDFNQGKNKRFHNIYFKPVISCITKLQTGGTDIFNDREITFLISCANEILSSLLDNLNTYGGKTALSWVKTDNDMQQTALQTDACKDILEKCGYYKREMSFLGHNPHFRYRNIYAVIDKMRKSDTILLSRVNGNDIYKLAFVYNNSEVLSLELKNTIEVFNTEFAMIGESQLNYYKKSFTDRLSKQEALELLDTCDRNNYPEGVIQFLLYFLADGTYN